MADPNWIDTPNLRIEFKADPNAARILTVSLRGKLDEMSSGKGLAKILSDHPLFKQASEIHFNLSGVKRINSIGVRHWVELMQTLQGTKQIVFDHISEAIVEQANLIPNILGRPAYPVLRIDLPCRCTSCGSFSCETLEPNSLVRRPEGLIAPPLNCGVCDAPLEPEVSEADYFFFLKPLLKSG